MRWLALIPMLVTGCARQREPAPEELESIAEFMFLHWEDEDTLAGAVANLAPIIEANVDAEVARDGWMLTPIAAETATAVQGPDGVVLDNLLGAAVAARSAYPIEIHAETLIRDDQVFSNPNNFDVYDRTVYEGDAVAFTTGEERLIRTDNDITTGNFGISVPYLLHKDYRWLSGRDFQDVIVGRAWISEEGCNAGGGNCLRQSWSIDLFYQQDEGSIRFTSTWSEVDGSISIGDDLLTRALASGMYRVFTSTEEWIDDGNLDTP